MVYFIFIYFISGLSHTNKESIVWVTIRKRSGNTDLNCPTQGSQMPSLR